MRPEQRGTEGLKAFFPRFKVGLETPIQGRFQGENKKLIFAPPVWYDALASGSLVLGLIGTLTWFVPIPIFDFFEPFRGAFPFVAAAGAWALLSQERFIIDLRARTYVRREGAGAFKRTIRGRLQELDALVLIATPYPVPVGMGVTFTYRLVLHWKGGKEPLLVLEREDRSVPLGMMPNAMAQQILSRGLRFAQEMGVPFFDNSHFVSPAPLRPV